MYSIRWRFVIIYLILVGIIFGLVSVAVSSMVENYLVKRYLQDAETSANRTALQIAPYLSDSDANSMYNICLLYTSRCV